MRRTIIIRKTRWVYCVSWLRNSSTFKLRVLPHVIYFRLHFLYLFIGFNYFREVDYVQSILSQDTYKG